MSLKNLLKLYDDSKKPGETPRSTFKRIWKTLLVETDTTQDDIEKFLVGLKLNTKRTEYTQNAQRNLYLHLLVRYSLLLQKNVKKGVYSE